MELRLTEPQKNVVEHDKGALLVVAGPGSGKTRVLTERVRRLLIDDTGHYRILALTFTNKAANEMAERLEGVPAISERAFIATLHSFCTEVLANRGKSVGIRALPNIFDVYQDRRQVLVDAIEQHPDIKRELKRLPDSRARSRKIDGWLKLIGEHKNGLVLPEMVENEQFRRLYSEYNNQLRISDAIDFDDLLVLTYSLFEARPKIAAFYRRQYRYICIDEAQDLNEAQYRVICSLCGDEHRNVMMVGDPKQAIFMWNGANPKYLDFFKKDYSASSIELVDNFRSARAVVDAAKKLNRDYSVEGSLPINGLLKVKVCQNEDTEAQFVVDTMSELMENGHSDIEGEIGYESFAVIGRNRFVFREVESLMRDENIPFFKKTGGRSFQSESNIVAEFEISLKLLANPRDRLHLAMLLKRWNIDDEIDEIYGQFKEVALTGETLLRSVVSRNQESGELIGRCLESIGWANDAFRLTQAIELLEDQSSTWPDAERALVMSDLTEWRKHWNTYVRSETGGAQTVHGFLSQVALGTTEQPSDEGVGLLSVHSAKGMEFDVVFLIGMNEDTFPDYRAKGSELEEEERNAFVAVTRSRRLLYVSYPVWRQMPWGDSKKHVISRYVRTIQRE